KKATDLQFTSTVESSDSSTEENLGRMKRKLKPNARLQDFITETKGRKKLQTLPYVKPKPSKVQEKDSSSSDESDLNIVFPQANSLKPIFHEQNSSTNGLESDSESVASVYCVPKSDKNNFRAATADRQHLLKEIFPDRSSTGELDAEPKVLSNIRGELRRFQEVVIKELKEIKTDLEIVRSSVVRQNQSRKPTCPFRIPFSNDCDVTASEEVLYSDKESFKNWCVSFGGISAHDHVRRILVRLFTHEYSLRFNFTGKGNKKAYKNLAIYPVVNSAVLESHRVTELVLEQVAGNFFRNAKDRNGGRAKRQKSSSNTSTQN
ncbi:unnamed protein product, partial [Allacma fusca]